MNRLRGLVAAAGVTMGLLAAASAQALPPVLDRVPTDALVVVTTPSLDRLERSMNTLSNTIALPMPVPGIRDIMAMGGIEKGVDTSRAVAVVLMPGDLDGDTPPMVILVPTADYAGLLGNFGGRATAGVDEVLIEGEPAFFRNLGDGYAAMSPSKDLAGAFTGRAGQLKAHETALGKSNKAIADNADLVVIANINALRPIIGPGLQEGIEDAIANSPLGMMGMGGEIPGMDMMQNLLTSIVDQGRSAVLGLRIDGAGLSIDLGAQFNEGSELARTFSRGGNTGDLFARVPNQPFFFAYAMDISSPGIKQAVTNMQEQSKRAAEAMRAMAGDEDAGPDFTGMMTALHPDKMDGSAMIIGASPGALMGAGLFVNSVSYTRTSDPSGFLNAVRTGMKEMDGRDAQGISVSTSYKEAAATIDGTPVDSWEMKMNMADADPMMGQAMGMFFGQAGGPNGYIAKTNGGVVQTFSRNSILMKEALNVAKNGRGLNTDPLLSQVAERLPPNRVLEGYIGMKPLLDMAKPMAAMMGGVDFDIPEQLPPVGFGMGAGDGATRMGIFIPAPVLKTVSDAAQAFQDAMGGGPGGPGGPAPRNRTGQPRF